MHENYNKKEWRLFIWHFFFFFNTELIDLKNVQQTQIRERESGFSYILYRQRFDDVGHYIKLHLIASF